MAKIAKFSVSHEFIHALLNLPSHSRVVLVAEGEFSESADVYVESGEFPDSEEAPRIKPVFERRPPVVLKDWGFETATRQIQHGGDCRMTHTEFVEKYQDNPDVVIAFGPDYIVAYRKDDYQEIDKFPFPMAGAVAMQILQDKLHLTQASE